MQYLAYIFLFYILALFVYCGVVGHSFITLWKEGRRDPRIRTQGLVFHVVLLLAAVAFIVDCARLFIGGLDATYRLELTVISLLAHFIVLPLMVLPIHYLTWLASSFQLGTVWFVARFLLLVSMMGVSVYVFSYRCGFQGQYLIKSDVIPGFHVYRSDAESLAEDSLLLLAVAIGSLLCGAYIWVRTSIVKDVRAELDSLPHLFIVSLICAVGWGVSFLSDPYHFYSANGYFIVLLTAYFLTYKALRARDRILAFPFAQNLTTGLIGGSQ